jgi:phage-related protein
MSEVDNRVVQLEFDNKDFEKNVKQSNKSLNKLKENLNFDDIGDSIDVVTSKISGLQVAMITFISNITNRLTNMAITFAKSLSVDQVTSGWSKYAEKMKSVATMVNQSITIAGKELTNTEDKLSAINEQIALMQWFADETSYSLTDMTSNVSKFTASGVDLDTAVEAMEGIATWAALAGQNSSTASRAMYQLAQAMGTGKIVLQDWKSIQNCNMDTAEFRETVLSTAVAMGKLTKEGENYITITGKKFTQSQFTSQLSEGWFTSEVLTTSLQKYSAAVDDIYKLAEQEGLTASEVIEKYGDTLDEFGVKAFKAAQEARTFSDAIDSVKDAVSSKWSSTSEFIFGGQEESTQLWTDLANELYDVFAASGDFRNNILEIWNSLGGRDDLFKKGGTDQGAFWNIFDSIVALKDLIKQAWNDVFPLSEMESESDQAEEIGNKVKTLTNNFKEFTKKLTMSEETATKVRNVLNGIFNIVKTLTTALKVIRFVIDPIVDTCKELANNVLTKISDLSKRMVDYEDLLTAWAIKLQNAVAKVIDILDPNGVLNEVYELIAKLWKAISNLNIVENLVNYIANFVHALKSMNINLDSAKTLLDGFKSIFKAIGNALIWVIDLISGTLIPAISKILPNLAKLGGILSSVVVKALNLVAKAISKIADFIASIDISEDVLQPFYNVLSKVPTVLNKLVSALKPVWNIIKQIPAALDSISVKITGNTIWNNILKFFDFLSSVVNKVANAISGSSFFKSIKETFTGVSEAAETVETATTSVTKIVKGTRQCAAAIDDTVSETKKTSTISIVLKTTLDVLKTAWDTIKIVAQAAWNMIKTIVKTMANNLVAIFNAITNAVSAAKDTNSEAIALDKSLLRTIIITGGIVAVVIALTTMIKNLGWAVEAMIAPVSNLCDSLSDFFIAKKRQIYVDMIGEVADAILKIVVALVMLSNINWSEGWKAALTIGISAAALAALIIYMVKSIKSIKESIEVVSDATTSVKKGAKKAMNSITSTVKNVGTEAKKMMGLNAISNIIKTVSSAFIKIALAMRLLQGIDTKTLLVSLAVFTTMGAVLAGIILVSKNIKEDQTAAISKNIKTILVLTVMFKLLASTLKKLASIDIASLWSAVGVLTVMAAVMVGSLAVINALSKAQKTQRQTSAFTKTVSGMVTIIASLAAMCVVLKRMSSVDQGSLWSAVGVMAVMSAVILALVAVISVLSKVTGGSSGMLVILIGLSTTMLSMAASMLIMSAAMSSLTDTLTRMADVQWTSILKMAAALGTFMVVGALGSAVAVPLLALAAAIALLGAGMLMAGYGAQLLNTNIVGCINNLTTALATAIPNFISGIIDSLTSLSTSVINMITELLSSALDMIVELAPKVKDAVLAILTLVRDVLVEGSETISEMITSLFQIVLDCLTNLIQPAVEFIINLLHTLIQSIHNSIDIIRTDLSTLVMDVLSIIFTILEDALPYIIQEVLVIVTKVLDTLTKYGPEFAGSVAKFVLSTIASALIIATSTIGTLASILLRFLAGLLNLVAQVARGLADVAYQTFKTIFWNIIDLICQVVYDSLTTLPKVLRAVGSKLLQAILDSLIDIVENNDFLKAIFDFFGWTDGLKEASKSLGQAYDDVMDSDVLSGKNITDAAAKASKNIKNTISSTATGIADDVSDAVSVINDSINTITAALTGTGDSDNDITLTVGLDTTSAQNSLSDLTGSISNTSGTVYGSNAYAASSGTTANGANTKTVNTDNSVTYNNTFNITGSDAQEVGDNVNTTLQRQAVRQRTAKGAI